jgi:predicted transcriptional regulator
MTPTLKPYPLITSTAPALDRVVGPLSATILRTVWNTLDPTGFTIRDVYEKLRESRTIAYTSTMTTIHRMAQAGILEKAPKSRLMHRLADSYAVNYDSERSLIREVIRRLDRE